MQWSPERLSAVLDAIEQRAGLTRSDIADLAGVHRSQVSRWFQGLQQPGYDKAMRLAGRLRSDHPELADEFLAAAGYADGQQDEDTAPLIRPGLYRQIIKEVGEEDAVAMLDFLAERRRRERQESLTSDRNARLRMRLPGLLSIPSRLRARSAMSLSPSRPRLSRQPRLIRTGRPGCR